MTAQILIIIPVLRRPQNAAKVAASIRNATPDDVARILFVASPGDEAEHDACRATGADLLVIDQEHGPGDYQRKINTAYRTSTEPLLLLGADDIRFHPGWFHALEPHLDAGFHVIGTNDLGNARVMRGEHATHCVVTREYADTQGTIDRRGEIMHEGYVHEYSDDELVQTAIMRDAWSFAEDSIVEHLHPDWGKAPTDELYDDQQRRMRASRQLFLDRRALWS